MSQLPPRPKDAGLGGASSAEFVVSAGGSEAALGAAADIQRTADNRSLRKVASGDLSQYVFCCPKAQTSCRLDVA